MHIKKLRIQNYKSFRDSGFMEFGPSFNVIVGQNNSGKTALLEALMLHNTPNKPHKRRDVKEFHQLDPYSDFEVDLVLSGVDLVDAWISRHGPVEQVRLDQLKQLSPLASFGVQLDTTIALKWNPNKNWQIRDELSRPLPLVLTAKGEFIDPSYGPPRSDLFLNLGPNDQNELVHLAQAALSGRTFGFKAERMNFAASGFDNGGPLSPDARNLASVLGKLFDSKTTRAKRFIEAVSEVLPSIEEVLSVQIDGNTRKIFIRNRGTDADRPDLANSLDECGTGVGQVLAILYVAMTMPPGIIVIDEPNSFLHPGAAKKLLQILAGYEHQYFIATHSPEIVSTLEADSVHLIEWKDGESHVSPIDPTQLAAQRLILSELGISLSDLFASDRIIWVEGKTEELCFPKLARSRLGKLPLGLSFEGVLQTSDFERKGHEAKKVLQLYDKVTSANGIMPTTHAIHLDRELRSEKDIDDLKRQYNGLLYFLPRRCYENYLLQPKSISAILTVRLGAEVTELQVYKWMTDNAPSHHPNKKAFSEGDFCDKVDAANLLKKLFSDLSDTKVEFSKTIDSIALTDWLIDHDPSYLVDLIDYVVCLVHHKETRHQN